MQEPSRTVVVTGAAHGLGRSVSEFFLGEGDTVFLVDRDAEGLHATISSLGIASGSRAVSVVLDVTDEDGIRSELIPQLQSAGPVQVLINNAAVYPFVAQPLEVTFVEHERAFTSTWDVNVVGTARMIHSLAPMLKESGSRGRIINISSVGVFVGEPTALLAYIASKGAISAMTKVYARLFAPFGVTCNTVAPGSFPTRAEDRFSPKEREEWDKELMGLQLIQRRGYPEEIAAVCGYLASDGAGFVTGQCLSVDGGWTLH